jgi:hypothetical protein
MRKVSKSNTLHVQIDHPPHYVKGKIEPIDVIEDWKLGYHLGNSIKYIARAPHKGELLKDLHKSKWYLNRLIGLLERCETQKEIDGVLRGAVDTARK